MEYSTFEEKKKKEGSVCPDRQNTKWMIEIARKCKHKWQPVALVLHSGNSPESLTNNRTYCVCMKCRSHTYIETAWIGYFLGSPDDLENPDEEI